MHIATLTTSRPLTPKPACVVPSPLNWRCISSLSNPSSPLRRPLGPALAHRLPGSRNNSTSHHELPLSAVEAGNIDNAPNSTLSPDHFAGQVLRELAREGPSQEGSSIRSPTLLLLNLFERLGPRGLVPQLTAEPPTFTPIGHGPSWTVTISLPELGIDVKGRGSNILFAEVAAAIQFDLALSRPDIAAKIPSFPQIRLSPEDANDIVQSYYQFVHNSAGPLKRTFTKLDSGAYEARIFAGSTQIGEPVTTAVKNAARCIQNLTVALGILNGHPNLWPVSLENPFQARIVLDRARLEKLRHLIATATDYLRTTPGQLVGEKQRGTFHKVVQGGDEQNTVDIQGGSEATTHRDIPDLQSWLAALPFPSPRAKMLVAGASMRCLEHAILLAAVEKHAIYRETVSPGEEVDGYRNPAIKNVMDGDHTGLFLLFQRLRDEKWIGKTLMRLPSTDDGQEESPRPHDNAQNEAEKDVTPDTIDLLSGQEDLQASSDSFPESMQTSSAKEAMVARRFDHFDPHGISSVSASAEEIERSMITAGLASYPGEARYIGMAGSDLKIRAEPYGGNSSRQLRKMSMLRHLLVLGFPENIAQIGHSSLHPGQPPQLRINSQEVYIDSPLKAHMPQKQLSKTLRAGPLMVVTGVTDNSEGGGLSARYSTPISTWEAVLLGKGLSLPDGNETSAAGAVHVLVNKWLPVLVKSEVEGVSNEQARDTLFEAREALHRAIDKAMYDYVKYSWHSFDFYNLLMGLPNEDSFLTMAMPREQRDAMRNEPRRPMPKKYQPALKHRTIKDVEN